MKILVTGDRNWKRPFLIHSMLWGLAMQSWVKGQPLIVVHGAAKGVDTIASQWVDEMIENRLEVQQRSYPAHWRHTDICPDDCTERVGRVAGPIRNGLMLTEKPQLVVAFHDDLFHSSRGTADMVSKARCANIPVVHIRRVPR